MYGIETSINLYCTLLKAMEIIEYTCACMYTILGTYSVHVMFLYCQVYCQMYHLLPVVAGHFVSPCVRLGGLA